jgi:hypothetical protein
MSWFERNYYHLIAASPSGVVPIGLFLIVHFYTHNYLLAGPRGVGCAPRRALQPAALAVARGLFIYLPIAFHAGLGIYPR